MTGVLRRKLKEENRTIEQIAEHYRIESELANRLKASTKEDRIEGKLYTTVYDELFRRVPHHQMLTAKSDAERDKRNKRISWQFALIRRFLTKEDVFLEIGAGDCRLSFVVAPEVEKVYGLDVSTVLTDSDSSPSNFSLVITDGINIPLEESSVSLAYSNQLMEHVHPDDAREQLAEIARVLKPGGRYICVTPNKVNGPWDISYYFDDVASGFHLKEYTAAELVALLKGAGLQRCQAFAGARNFYLRVPLFVLLALERVVASLPGNLRLAIGRALPIRAVLGIRIVGIKS